MKYVTVEYYVLFDKKMSIFGSFGQKEHLLCYKGCEEIVFSQLVVSFDFLKSILDGAILAINMIFKFWLKT